jgi:hypothetical protein
MSDAFGSSYGPPPAPQQPSPQGAPAFGSSFLDSAMQTGKSFLGAFLGPQYRPTNPNASPLDQSADLLQQRINQASSIATNPFAQMFAPEKVQAARDFVPQATEQLRTIQQQRQQQLDTIQAARNRGLTNPNQFGPGATDTTLNEESLRQWKDEGNFDAYKALQGAGSEWENRANLYMPEAMEKFSQRVNAAQDAINTLDGAAKPKMGAQAYNQKRQQVVSQLTQFGIKDSDIPKTAGGWIVAKGPLQAKLNQALGTLNSFNAAQDRLGQAVPITDDKVAGRVENSFQFSNGEAIPGHGAVMLPGKGGVMGVQGPPGSFDTAKRGMDGSGGWSNAPPAQIETVQKQLASKEAEGAINRYKMTKDFYDATHDPKMYTSAAGLTIMKDKLTGIGRDVAEDAKNPGSIGLARMYEQTFGSVESARNRLANEAGALQEWLGRKPEDRLSPPSIAGLRYVAEFEHNAAVKQMNDRLSQPFETAGRYGMKLKDLGLDKEITSLPDLYNTWNDARIAGNNAIDSYPMIRIGDRAVRLPQNSHVPGAKVMQLDHSGSGAIDIKFPKTGQASPSQGAFAPGPSSPQGVPNVGGSPTSRPFGDSPVPSAAPAGTPSSPAAPVHGDPNNPPGRWGLTPGMKLDSPQAVASLANREIQLESGFKPKQRTGSYVGLGQWSQEEMQRHGITDPDDLEQNRTALQADIRTRADKLQRVGLPVTAANVYLMHQQGEAGLEAHLRNPDGLAWQNLKPFYRSAANTKWSSLAQEMRGQYPEATWNSMTPDARTEAIAKQAVWGNMTDDMRAQFGARGGVNAVTSGDFTRLWDARTNGTDVGYTPADRARMAFAQDSGLAPRNRTAPRALEAPTSQSRAGMFATTGPLIGNLINRAMESEGPAIGGTVGGLAGGALGGPAGAIAGGAAGGVAGQAAKDWLSGNPQQPGQMVKQGVLQGVLGVAPAGRPVVGALARMGGAGVVEGASKYAEGGDRADVVGTTFGGAASAGAGELFGRALGMVTHKVFKLFGPDAQEVFRGAAADLHEANETLRTEPEKLPGIAGGAETANPKYEAAKDAKDKAESTIKEMIPTAKPDEVAYAHKVSAGPVPTPAAVAKAGFPGAKEQAELSAAYEQLHGEVGATGIPPSVSPPKLPDGPVWAVDNGKVSEKFRETAERAEAAATAPRFDPETKSRDLQKIRSSLLEAEQNALTSNESDRAQTAKDMRKLADTIRVQQERLADHVLGPNAAKPWIQRLRTTDYRYRKLMDATNGGNLEAAAGLKGEAGRTADRAFRAFAQNDPAAVAAWNYMRVKAGNPDATEKSIFGQISLENIPHIGKYIATGKSILDIPKWMRDRAAGSPAQFGDFVPGYNNLSGPRSARDIAGSKYARFGADSGWNPLAATPVQVGGAP